MELQLILWLCGATLMFIFLAAFSLTGAGWIPARQRVAQFSDSVMEVQNPWLFTGGRALQRGHRTQCKIDGAQNWSF